jgi:hypothetical protein
MKESLEEEREVEKEIERRRQEADAQIAKATANLTLSEENKGVSAFLGGIFHRSRDGSIVTDSARHGTVRREKSISDNVASMRAMTFSENPNQAIHNWEQSNSLDSPGIRRLNTMADFAHSKRFEEFDALVENQALNDRRRRMKCQSEGVFTMRMANENNPNPRLFLDSTVREGPEKLVTLAELTKISAAVSLR